MAEIESDESLVKRTLDAPEGDTAAFEEIVRRHQSRVLANCRYLTRSSDDAEDLAQEVFVKAFYKISGFEGRSQFKTWLQRIKVNHCLNFLRRHRGRTFVDIDEPALHEEGELQVKSRAHADAVSGEERDLIRGVLNDMPDHIRVPLVLRDVDGLSYDEIRETLGIGLSATKMRIKRAREEFRRQYESVAGSSRGASAASVSAGDET